VAASRRSTAAATDTTTAKGTKDTAPAIEPTDEEAVDADGTTDALATEDVDTTENESSGSDEVGSGDEADEPVDEADGTEAAAADAEEKD
jgi:hypothetical protein